MTQKERVLAKCGELAPELDLNYGFGGGLIQRRFGTSTIYTDWGNVSLSEDNPEDDPVWPIAAQILGIGEEELPADPLEADRELVKKFIAPLQGQHMYVELDFGSPEHDALKRLAGMEVQNG